MNLLVVIPLVLALLVLRLVRPSMLVWAGAWWVGMFVFLRFGFAVPLPLSVIKLFMGIVTLALVAYVTSDQKRLSEVREPLVAFLTEPRFTPALALVALLIPAGAALLIYLDMTEPVQPPSFARTIHPAPPDQITVHDQRYDLTKLDNPFRKLESSDTEAFAAHVEKGREVYYHNCFYCHGDRMRGEGLIAHGLNPIPTNFQDPGTIAMLQEGFLFWRISKGGPGLPSEGGPWESAMPEWERFLDQDQIWDVILFLYEFTGQRPRARAGGEG
jgi:hypothetical protein